MAPGWDSLTSVPRVFWSFGIACLVVLVISEVLGGNMASRLFVEVREKRGLVYGVSAGLAGNKQIGAMRIYAGTTPEQGHECLQVIVKRLV